MEPLDYRMNPFPSDCLYNEIWHIDTPYHGETRAGMQCLRRGCNQDLQPVQVSALLWSKMSTSRLAKPQAVLCQVISSWKIWRSWGIEETVARAMSWGWRVAKCLEGLSAKGRWRYDGPNEHGKCGSWKTGEACNECYEAELARRAFGPGCSGLPDARGKAAWASSILTTSPWWICDVILDLRSNGLKHWPAVLLHRLHVQPNGTGTCHRILYWTSHGQWLRIGAVYRDDQADERDWWADAAFPRPTCKSLGRQNLWDSAAIFDGAWHWCEARNRGRSETICCTEWCRP